MAMNVATTPSETMLTRTGLLSEAQGLIETVHARTGETEETRRLSDEYLDLDLLDERAREILGYVRADEVILR